MKKVLALIVVFGLAIWINTSCGGKKDEAKKEADDGYSDYETADGDKPSADDLIKQGQTLADASDCKTCHHATNKIVGPAHAEVAKKYEFTQANVTYLANKIIQGGSGVWGEVPMTPHADMSQADAEKMAMYVLSLDGEKPKD
jgi:cytochrome c